MKRTLKRELKVLEIVKGEKIKFKDKSLWGIATNKLECLDASFG